MTDIEEALALLAAPCTDDRFFQRALKALALVTQCRWTAFARLSSDKTEVELLWFCDNKQLLPGFSFPMQHSPCEKLYRQRDVSHILYPRDLQKAFPDFALIRTLGAQSYQGELILGDGGEPLGHILVMDPLPQEENTKSREFFRLLAQRIGVEYRRLLVARQLNLHKEMIKATRHMMSFIDRNYHYRVVSKGYELTFNRPASEIEGKQVAELHGEATFSANIKPLIDKAFSGETLHTQHWIHPPPPNPPIYVSVHHNPYIDENGNISGVIVSAHDITAIHQAEKQQAYLSSHDALTGAHNREALMLAMRELKSSQLPFGLVYLDLCDFSSINEKLGRSGGDDVLAITSKRLQGNINNHDLVARIAGDEFVVLVRFDKEAELLGLPAQLIRLESRLITRLSSAIHVGSERVQLSARTVSRLCINPLDSAESELAMLEKAMASGMAQRDGTHDAR
ncbi:GGDEF domain-containing protein [Shewanella sp. JM162201]|uniref:GGDEF domain-containing protein n=1 Tax=Shewanella jiangmenensis TaxID=2837387 RepID=A0ABS5V712_9GAMM|nr:sensor domain-containing diguanylate cyclase [Shewanella jiangmenensis]MBT1445637.1 GGDEF domain-containing protein [Shewanella jiangmenensis]